MSDKKMSWWDGVLANLASVQKEVSGLNNGAGPNMNPMSGAGPMRSLADLMPKKTYGPMHGAPALKPMSQMLPADINWNPMASAPVSNAPGMMDQIQALNGGQGPNWNPFNVPVNNR